MHKDSSPKLSHQGLLGVIAVLSLGRFTGKKVACIGRNPWICWTTQTQDASLQWMQNQRSLSKFRRLHHGITKTHELCDSDM